MNCVKAKKKMALHVSGDLPEREKAALELHLLNCRACREEFEIIKRSQAAIVNISKSDIPRPLGEDFSQIVRQNISDESSISSQSRRGLSALFGWKPALGISAALVIIVMSLLYLGGVFDRGVTNRIAVGTAVSWEKISKDFAGCIDGPYSLDNYNPPPEAGVFAILQKINGDVYKVLYCDESNDLASYRAYPWIYQRQRQILSYAGSDKNVYVAVCLKPESSRSEREVLEKNIIEEYKPKFNKKSGA